MLLDNPNDTAVVHFMAYIYMSRDNMPMAYHLFRECLRKTNNDNRILFHYAKVCHELHQFDEALAANMEVIKNNPTHALSYANMASCLVNLGKYEEAEKAGKEAIELDPESHISRANYSMALLANRKWEDGWKYYDMALGGKARKAYSYGETKGRWKGEPGRVVIHGEQGLGDEIMFASCVPDACEKATVVLDVEKRLEGLFKRSFPKAKVYGTRHVNDPEWLEEFKPEYNCAIGSLPGIFRNHDRDFPGTPYLVPDPERVTQWKAIFKKPVIGIAWSGGIYRTNSNGREIPLKAFQPLFDMFDAEFVSLQYRPVGDDLDGTPVRHFKRATETDDYDDTAALIASCDLVIGVHTAALHTAAALGVPTLCLLPRRGAWVYAQKDVLWYKSMYLFKQRNQETWNDTIKRFTLTDHRWLRQARSRCVPRVLPVSSKQSESPGSIHAVNA